MLSCEHRSYRYLGDLNGIIYFRIDLRRASPACGSYGPVCNGVNATAGGRRRGSIAPRKRAVVAAINGQANFGDRSGASAAIVSHFIARYSPRGALHVVAQLPARLIGERMQELGGNVPDETVADSLVRPREPGYRPP